MQTIWTRAAQVRASCRCPQCLSTTHGVSRRATGAATRRMPKYLTSSTLWYSGIFAAAATFDASVKKRRREQWERAIADVRQDLGQSVATQEDNRQILQETEVITDQSTVDFQPLGGSIEEQDIFTYVDEQQPRPQWPTNTGPALNSKFLPPQSLYASDGRVEQSEKAGWVPKKLARVQLTIDVFQLALFLHLQHNGWGEEAILAVPEEYSNFFKQDQTEIYRLREVKRQNLQRLKAANKDLSDYQPVPGDRTFCHFAQDTDGEFHRAARDLNSSLQNLFRQRNDQRITTPALLAKLSYNLSISSAPPNLKTYNTILLGLSNLKQHLLANNLIAAMCESHIRINEVSMIAILKHYTDTDQADLFTRYIERMRGNHGGLALARPDIRITESGQSRLIRSEEQPERVIQLPYATPDVFAAVIKGVIKFASFDTALRICEGMGQEGWGLCMGGLTPLLQNCADRGDWTSGTAVWKQIQVLKNSSRRQEGFRTLTERIGLDTFAAMLRLCSRCGEKTTFDEVWDQAMRSHRQAGARLLQIVKGEGGEKDDAVVERAKTRCEPFHSRSILNQTEKLRQDVAKAKIPPPSILKDETTVLTPSLPVVQNLNDVLMETKQDDVIRNTDVDTDDTQSEPSQPYRTASSTSRHAPSHRHVQLLPEQLLGMLPPGHDLDEYELRERPMTAYS